MSMSDNTTREWVAEAHEHYAWLHGDNLSDSNDVLTIIHDKSDYTPGPKDKVLKTNIGDEHYYAVYDADAPANIRDLFKKWVNEQSKPKDAVNGAGIDSKTPGSPQDSPNHGSAYFMLAFVCGIVGFIILLVNAVTNISIAAGGLSTRGLVVTLFLLAVVFIIIGFVVGRRAIASEARQVTPASDGKNDASDAGSLIVVEDMTPDDVVKSESGADGED